MRTPRNDRLTPHDIADAAAPAAPERTAAPERKCVLSGGHGPRDGLIRLALSPPGADGACTVLPDVLARAPGRGAWIAVSCAELETAIARGKLKGALQRSFGKALAGAALTVPGDLPRLIDAALVRVLTDRLGLELRAGRLLLGSDRIAERARAGRVAWLAHAADAGGDGSRKLDQAWRVGSEAEGSSLAGVILPLDRAALSVALGRDNVVHLALTDAAAAGRVSATLQRLLGFRGCGQAQDDDATGRRESRDGSADRPIRGGLTEFEGQRD